jgi:hypothetical protein
MIEVSLVEDYIRDNILYTEKWDEVYMEKKQVVVNNAEAILLRELPHHFNDKKPVPIDVIAEQCIHILEFDDSHRRAEMGVSYFMASGLYVSFDKSYNDRSIAKTILFRYPRRRSGRSVVNREDTYRVYTSTKLGDY